MGVGIAIFVKTPGHSPLKTRLAVDTGVAFAEQWHARAAAAVAEVALAATRGLDATPCWAVAEAAALGDPRWSTLPVLAQGEGGLGARMRRVQALLVARHGAGVLLGADAPQLTPQMLRDAIEALDAPTPRLVLGPAADGGFWLFGANRPLPAAPWEAVPYSRADTAARLRAAFAAQGEWRALPPLVDVDTARDLGACQRALAALAAPTPAQSALQAWTAAHAPPAMLEP